MKKTVTLIVAFVCVALLSAALAGAAMWWYRPGQASAADTAAPKKIDTSRKPAKYVTLEKVIVMLRRTPGEAEAHYLSAELVLATTAEKEKLTKEHLPMLRSIAVLALSSYPMSVASVMTVEQYADKLNRTFDASYAKDKAEKPFSDVMIGKLIIE